MVDYNPDIDVLETGGRRGMALAELIIRRAGGFDVWWETLKSKVDNRRCNRLDERRDREDERYVSFYEAVRSLNPSPLEIRRLLAEHFPGRFSSGGIQDVFEMTDEDVFGTYQGVIRYAEKVVEGKRNK